MTLAETLLALTIVGVLTTIAVPQARRGLDGLKVRGAREAAFGIATQARMAAVAHGGVDLVFDLGARTATIVDGTGATIVSTSFTEYDVDLLATGATSRIVLHYDSRGIGRMASQTLRFQRGVAQAGLTFSSYGRIRRW